ncbi:CapA family protein [Bradyrhizobium sp. UFLA05-109]
MAFCETFAGAQFSDFCVVTNHGHEPGNWSQEPPDYVRSFAHRRIDTGATAHVGHGPHRLRGNEIYKGRPSPGNFIFISGQIAIENDVGVIRLLPPRCHDRSSHVNWTIRETRAAPRMIAGHEALAVACATLLRCAAHAGLRKNIRSDTAFRLDRCNLLDHSIRLGIGQRRDDDLAL